MIQVMLFSVLNGPFAGAVTLPSHSSETTFRFATVVLYFRMSFWSEDHR
jgi:hypothetical protein